MQPRYHSPQTPPIRQFEQMCQLIVVVSSCLFPTTPPPDRHQFVQQHSMYLESNTIRLQCQTRRPETCSKSCLRCYNMPHVHSSLSPIISINLKSTLMSTNCRHMFQTHLQFVSSCTQMPRHASNRLNSSPNMPLLPHHE